MKQGRHFRKVSFDRFGIRETVYKIGRASRGAAQDGPTPPIIDRLALVMIARRLLWIVICPSPQILERPVSADFSQSCKNVKRQVWSLAI